MAGINRLMELKTDDMEDEPEVLDTADDVETRQHMSLYEPIKAGLNLIRGNVGKVERLKNRDRTAASDKARKEIMNELDQVMNATTQEAVKIKAALDEIKIQNLKFEKEFPASAKSDIRDNLYQTHLRKLHTVMNTYNTASQEFKHNLQERTRRQLKIVTAEANIDDEELEKIVESGQASDVIKNVLMTGNLRSVVQDIEERHLDILKLEQQVLEVYELFRDLAQLVDIQQESLDVIENRVVNARAYTEKAETEIIKAEIYQKKARQRYCCLCTILMVVLVVVLLFTVPWNDM